MLKDNLIHSRTCVYNVNYHIVFSTKYRSKVLTDEIAVFLQNEFQLIAKIKGFNIRQVKIGHSDHVHIFASAHPKVSPSYIVKMIKGISARHLFMCFPKLKEKLWKGHLWNPSFYIETIGHISENTIKRYIEDQKKT